MFGWFIGVMAVLYLLYLLHDLAALKRQLGFVRQHTTNQELTIKSNNRLMRQIAQEMNEVLREKKQLRSEVAESKRQLDQAINNISHDLRTPLTVASGYTQYLRSKDVAQEERAQLLDKIGSNLAHVEERLELLLDYNRLNEDRFVIELENVPLSKLLEERLLDMYAAFQEQDFEVQPQIAKDLEIIADSKVLGRIIQNLLGNMLAHGQGPGQIILRKADDGRILLQMINQLKAPIQAPEKLTERFYTEDLSRQNQNSGLGLYIVQQLVAKQEATMDLAATKDTFTINIYFKQK